jgi:hypothetical protein
VLFAVHPGLTLLRILLKIWYLFLCHDFVRGGECSDERILCYDDAQSPENFALPSANTLRVAEKPLRLATLMIILTRKSGLLARSFYLGLMHPAVPGRAPGGGWDRGAEINPSTA